MFTKEVRIKNYIKEARRIESEIKALRDIALNEFLHGNVENYYHFLRLILQKKKRRREISHMFVELIDIKDLEI